MEIYFLHELNLPLDVEAPNDAKRKFKHYVGNQGRSQKFLFEGPICVANLLVYTNFYIHTQTHVSIHTQKKLVSFIMNP